MELVEGEDLSARLAKGPPLTLDEVLTVAEGVGKALRAVWKFKIVHRDLKPANIFLAKDGTVKVADFGLAASVGLHPVESRFVVGTLAYLSPEQGIGGEVDVRSDMYSLGVVLFELASGELPFGCPDSSTSVIWKHRFDPPPSLSARGKVPDYIDAILQRCLAKKPQDRFQVPDEFIECVQAARQRLATDAQHGGYGRRLDDTRPRM
jgi:serine/threonine-protein kinase